MPRRAVFLLLTTALAAGCAPPLFSPDDLRNHVLCAAPDGREVVADVAVDPEHCGQCGVACARGVSCVLGRCDYSSRVHCGAADRSCVGFAAGIDVDCLPVAALAEDDLMLGEVVAEHACVAVASVELDVPSPPSSPVDVDVAPDDPWLLVPSRSTRCRGADDPRCHHAFVEHVDPCGDACTLTIDHDFEIMTHEVSRAQYRDTMCRCAGDESVLCRDVCADGADEQALPVTGVSWCEAYEVCQHLGGRLPTAVERARVEALVAEGSELFGAGGACASWRDETGSMPWTAECQDVADGVELAPVDSREGRLLIGGDVLPTPRPLYHWRGNANEWGAEPAEAATCAALQQGDTWAVSTTDAERQRPRVVQGLGLYSPTGLSGNVAQGIEPDARASDLGVRCARTAFDTDPDGTPYDSASEWHDHALCPFALTGLWPVRHAVGDQVHRAVDLCVDWSSEAQPEVRRRITSAFRSWLLDGPLTLVRHPFGQGRYLEIGHARLARDEQWWIAPPAAAFGEPLRILDREIMHTFEWIDEDRPTEGCAQTLIARTDGEPMIRRQFLGLDLRDLRRLERFSSDVEAAEFACAALSCRVPVDPAECVTACDQWVLPLVADFRHVVSGPTCGAR